MGFIEKRSGRYRIRYRDPLGHQRSATFTRKADAERFLREMQVAVERGRWIDPAGADLELTAWAGEFLSLARRLSPSTQDTYRRDLRRYILPKFGTYRLGRLPAGEIENWLNDEIAGGLAASSVHRHYRTLGRVLQVAVEKERIPNNPLISSSFWQHYFQPALQATGLACRFHDLRHTSVALAIAEGGHPKAIQARMGHSSINVTLDRYGHLFPELDEALAMGFGERLTEARQEREKRRAVVVQGSFGQDHADLISG